MSWLFIRRYGAGLLFLIPLFIPAEGQAHHNDSLLHSDSTQAQMFAPILWFATDERLRPMMPHPFAFDGVDNDSDGVKDLEDPKEIMMGEHDLEWTNRLLAVLDTTNFVLQTRWDSTETESLLTSQHYVWGRELEGKTFPPSLRKAFSLKRIPLSDWVDWKSLDPTSWQAVEHLRQAVLPGMSSLDLEGGSVSAAFLKKLQKEGVIVSGGEIVRAGDHWELRSSGHSPVYGLREVKSGIAVYGGNRYYTVTRDPNTHQLIVVGDRRLPPFLVCYGQAREDNRHLTIQEYWFYYLLDIGEGPHKDDAENAFVYVDSLSEVAGVVAAGHTGASANNILVRGRGQNLHLQLPERLPRHMPILVELGKHASAPDRGLDGQFNVGMDANCFYQDVWGSRDVATAFGIKVLRQVKSEFSFPRDKTTLLFEERLNRARVGHDPDCVKTLTETDCNYLREMHDAQIPSYRLFPIRDLRILDSLLAVSDGTAASQRDVEAFLAKHEECFWGNAGPRRVAIQADAFAVMRQWGRSKNDKQDFWLHENYQHPERVFKLWLFPSMAATTSFLLVSGHGVVRIGVQAAELRGGLKVSTLEGYTEYDFAEGQFRTVGVLYNLFRGSHHGLYGGLGWEFGDEDKENALFTLGLVPISWDLRSIPKLGTHLCHAQVLVRSGVRASMHWGDGPWNLDPIQFELGLQIGFPIRGPRHPLDY